MPATIQPRVHRSVGHSAGARAAAAVLLALTLTLLPRSSDAQGTAVGFERIAQEDGLSNGTVTAIAQSPSGFLWMGTEDGLNRYDGSGFTTYRSSSTDSTSLGHSWVSSLLVSAHGDVWVGTLGGGLNLLIPKSGGFRRYRHRTDDPRSLSSDRVYAIHETEGGMLWVGSARGLDRLDPSTGLTTRHAPAPGDSSEDANAILAIAADDAGQLWLGTRHGILLFDREQGRFIPVELGLSGIVVLALARDSRGVIWVGSEHELMSVDPVGRKLLSEYAPATRSGPSLFGGRVLTLRAQPGGKLWVGSDDGLTELDPTTGRYVRHRHDLTDPTSLGGNIVRSVLVDRGGVLWVGLESYGLSKYAPSAIRFETIREDPSSTLSLSNGYVRGITEDSQGATWIATQFGGLNRLDRERKTIRVYRKGASHPLSLPSNDVWDVLEDSSGTLWVGLHDAGLGTLDPRTGAFVRSAALEPDESVNVLYEDRSGALLIGTEGGGMVELSPDRKRTVRYGWTLGERRVLASDDVQAILEDSEGILWVGGAFGLTRLDRQTGQSMRYHGAAGEPGKLQSDFITNIIEDSRGILWFATKGGGLSSFDRATGTFSTLGIEQGLPHSFIYGILEDARGNLWLSSDDGIARLNPRTGQITSYGLQDGLQAREFNRRAFHRSSDGTMFFGGVNGLTMFRPDLASAAPPTPPVSFLTIRSTDSTSRLILGFTMDSVVRLRHDENAFSIVFRALDFTEPSRIAYSYRLDGVDRGWVNSGNRGEANYASVPPGHYVFRARSAGRDGVWREQSAAFTIVVSPPWWGTWWARALGVLVAAAVVAGLIRLRLNGARRRNAMLQQQVDIQTRELTDAQARLRSALEREREATRELFDITAAVPGAVFQMRETVNGRREFSFVSEGVRRLWLDKLPAQSRLATGDADRGLLAERLIGLAHPSDARRIARSLAVSRKTLQPWSVEWRLNGGGDVPAWLSVQAHTSREPDGAVTWTGVVTDVTAAREAETARAALEAKMLHAQQAESLAVLAGGVAHDFNNLLVGVLGNAELLADELPADGDGAEIVGHIRSAALRAADLTRQLLAYAGRGRFVIEPVDLAELVSEMLALVRSAVPRTVAFEFRNDESSPPIVDVDATQLRQVVMNLVTNASEAIGIGPGTVTVEIFVERLSRSQLTLLHAAADMPAIGPYAVLDVADNGVGLDQASLARIFDPFYSTKFTGRGLGLAALLGVVRAHHGGLNVITAPGQGARFRIYLPLSDREVVRPTTMMRPASEPSTFGHGARVLVVDDEADVLHLTERLLRKLGYEVIASANGAGAIDAIMSVESVDLVLMDVTMPELSGPETARELRERGIDLPVVLMSGYAEEELVARGVLAYACGFLQKPFAERELAAAMEAAMEVATTGAARR